MIKLTNVKKTKNPNIFKGKAIVVPDPPKPASKPATILYKKLPDNMILITGFENFLTADELFDKYGRPVAKAYLDYPYNMAASLGAVFLKGASRSFVSVGEVISKNDFSAIITQVKKCGSLLHDIIAAVNDGQVKKITI